MNTNVKEFHHIIRVANPMASFRDQLADVLDKLCILAEGKKVFFLRFFISDAANQQDLLVEAAAERGLVEYSVIQQPPLDGSKISAWLWAVEGELNPVYHHKVTYAMTSSNVSLFSPEATAIVSGFVVLSGFSA